MQTLIRKPLAALHAMGGTHLQRSLTRQIKHVIAGHRANHPKDEWGGVGVPEWSIDAHDLDAPPKAAAVIWTGQPCQVAADALEEDGSPAPPFARSRQGGPPPRRRWTDRAQMAILCAILRATLGQIEARRHPTCRPWTDRGRIEDRLAGARSDDPPPHRPWSNRGETTLLQRR